MQDRFGVARRLRDACEDQLASGEERMPVEARGHRDIGCVVGVLKIDLHRKSPQRTLHELLVDDAIVQPVGDVLRRDATSRTIFHKRDVVDVWNL